MRFRIVREAAVHEINGRRIAIELKIFEGSNLVIEARTAFGLDDARSLLELKNMLFDECRSISKEFNPSNLFEEYTFFCIKDFEGTIDAYIANCSEDIAALLKEESIKLARREIDDTLISNIRYGLHDIAIVDWDGAFLIDQSGEFRETIAVLELANIQLLNFRLLDKKLEDKIIILNRHIKPLAIGSFLRLSPFMKDIVKIRSDSVLELENIESSLKLYGDWYSGKLYDLASKKFHLSSWRVQVQAKLEVLEDLYEMADQITTERYNLILEFLIVFLIIFELVLAYLKK